MHTDNELLQTQLALFQCMGDRFNVVPDSSLADLVHYMPHRDQPFHRWFRYREGFAPELVGRAIVDLERSPDLVLDPFCGCGTTLFAAKEVGIPSIGIDVNPVAVLVANSKLCDYKESDIEGIQRSIGPLSHLTPGSPRSPKPGLSIIDQVFKSDILDALLIARHAIENEDVPQVRDFLLVGWLSILEGVSNVFKEGNGIKYRNRKRTPQGYHTIPWEETSVYQQDAFDLVSNRLREQYTAMISDLTHAPTGLEATAHLGSALRMGESLEPGSVDLCVFSPPYCNNFNYMKIFKVELWMGGFVRSYREILDLSHGALRSHVEMPINLASDLDLPSEVLQVAEWIGRGEIWHPKIPSAVIAYFADMQVVLRQVHRALRPGGQCHIVVGNSAYGGVLVPTDLLLAEIAQCIGFQIKRLAVTRHLTTSSQQRSRLNGLLHGLRETVMVLVKR